MKYEIKNRWSGELIYSTDANSWEQVIKEARANGANLSGANLSDANLRSANLSGANLSYANLSYANLSYADLSGANLRYANLRYANLRYANLRYANLSDADLRSANLTELKGLYQIVPEEGSFIGFKKLGNGVIAKIQIPEGAGRVGGYTDRKCRAEKAYVIEGEGPSKHDSNFIYKVGEVVVPDSWNSDPREVCAAGIHFFITRREAEQY